MSNLVGPVITANILLVIHIIQFLVKCYRAYNETWPTETTKGYHSRSISSDYGTIDEQSNNYNPNNYKHQNNYHMEGIVFSIVTIIIIVVLIISLIISQK